MSDLLDTLMNVPPELTDAIIQTLEIVQREMAKPDVSVEKWLIGQWNASMMALPTVSERGTGASKTLLDHMGYIALTMGRIGFTDVQPFTTVAALFLGKFEEIYSNLPDEPATEPRDPSQPLH